MCGAIKLFNLILLMLYLIYNYLKNMIQLFYTNTLRIKNYINYWAKWYFYTKFKNICFLKIILLCLIFFGFYLVCVIIYYNFFNVKYDSWCVVKYYYLIIFVDLNSANFLLEFYLYYNECCLIGKSVKLMLHLNNLINLYSPVLNSFLWDLYFYLINLFFYFKIIINFCYTFLDLMYSLMLDLKNRIILYLWIFILFIICKNLYVNYYNKSLQVYLLSMDFHKTLLFLWVVW